MITAMSDQIGIMSYVQARYIFGQASDRVGESGLDVERHERHVRDQGPPGPVVVVIGRPRVEDIEAHTETQLVVECRGDEESGEGRDAVTGAGPEVV